MKQNVAVVRGGFCRWMVFRTANDPFYLFSQLDPNGNQTCPQVPVRKVDLQPEVRSMLARLREHVE